MGATGRKPRTRMRGESRWSRDLGCFSARGGRHRNREAPRCAVVVRLAVARLAVGGRWKQAVGVGAKRIVAVVGARVRARRSKRCGKRSSHARTHALTHSRTRTLSRVSTQVSCLSGERPAGNEEEVSSLEARRTLRALSDTHTHTPKGPRTTTHPGGETDPQNPHTSTPQLQHDEHPSPCFSSTPHLVHHSGRGTGRATAIERMT